METSKLGLILGYFNVILYSISGITFLYFAINSDFMVGVCVFMAALSLIMVLLSVLLIMGIIEKRYILMAPWVYSIIFLNITISIIFDSLPKSDPYDICSDSTFLTICLNLWYALLIWIPIYYLYQDMRSENINDQLPLRPLRSDYAPVP